MRCDRTGLVAEIEHRGSKGTEIIGTVYGTRVRHTGDDDDFRGDAKKREEEKTALYSLRGRVDGRVTATATEASPNVPPTPFVVYDAVCAAHREASNVAFDVAFDFNTAIDPRGSRVTWRAVADAMRAKPAPAWDAARRAKLRVEADEARRARRAGLYVRAEVLRARKEYGRVGVARGRRGGGAEARAGKGRVGVDRIGFLKTFST